MMTPQFQAAVEKFGPRLMTDLGLTNLQACGIFGNLAVESGQFKLLQEIAPTVKGSRGGYGWCQWTGPRRRAYEAWCAAGGLKPSDQEANYGYLLVELRGAEKAALAALKRAKTLDAATTVFMERFERPGIPHLDKRKAYALEALDVLETVTSAEADEARPIVPIATPAADVVSTVTPAGKAPGLFGALWNLARGRKAIPAVPAVAGTKNDPTIFYVQKMLRDRAYYTKGFVDGLDGKLTEEAVAQARKDNGMGDGGVDAAFLTQLPSFPQRPVSAARANIGIVAATQHAPEVMKPSLGLLGTGLSLLGIGGADDIAGALGKVQGAAGQAGDIMTTVQSAFGTIATGVAWIVEHRRIVLILVGLFVIFKAISWLLSGWIKIRQAFF